LALVVGEKTWTDNDITFTRDILHFGGTLQTNLDLGGYGLALDLFYLSGDAAADDDTDTGFVADPNFQQGLLLHRHVITAQTAHGAGPSPDGGGATFGQMTNTIGLFPRAWWRLADGFEVYGGLLVAFAEQALTAPDSLANSQGPTNYLGGPPSAFLGAELDFGLRYRALIHGAEASLAIETGILFPGPAFDDANGRSMFTLYGGRLLLGVRL
jgi:hypothetical protein